MNDKTDNLSSLMDGELNNPDKCLKSIANNAQMKASWKRYHLARDAMKGQLSDYPLLDVSAAVSESLKNEAVVLAPLWRRISPRYVMKQAAGLAIAAAVGTIAILSVQQAQLVSSDVQVIAAASAPATNTNNGQIRQVSFTTREKLDVAVESKLSGYLVNHNEYSKSTRVSRVMPYTRIVSFQPTVTTQQVENDK